MPDFVSLSNVFIDDILIWDGRIFLGVLGGAGVHAMAGARVWSESIGLVASIGKDFNEEFEAKLRDLGMDLSMLHIDQEKTTRAWQIFQPDEERIEIYRDKMNTVHQISLEDIALSDPYRQAKGYHLSFSGSTEQLIANLKIMRANNPSVMIVLEPTVPADAWGRDGISEIFSLVDVFSPNDLEGQVLTGQDDPAKMIEELLDWGVEKVALRMGANGSLIGSRDLKITPIHAVKETLVDVTGAGNAYLGGMLVALCQGLGFAEAALRGSVSASFAIEQFGICLFNETMVAERDRRLEKVHEVMAASSR